MLGLRQEADAVPRAAHGRVRRPVRSLRTRGDRAVGRRCPALRRVLPAGDQEVYRDRRRSTGVGVGEIITDAQITLRTGTEVRAAIAAQDPVRGAGEWLPAPAGTASAGPRQCGRTVAPGLSALLHFHFHTAAFSPHILRRRDLIVGCHDRGGDSHIGDCSFVGGGCGPSIVPRYRRGGGRGGAFPPLFPGPWRAAAQVRRDYQGRSGSSGASRAAISGGRCLAAR